MSDNDDALNPTLSNSSDCRLSIWLNEAIEAIAGKKRIDWESYERQDAELAKRLRALQSAFGIIACQIPSSGTEVNGSASTLPLRRMLGEYLIIWEIGRGGMGIVYLAFQESLGRLVALKTLAGDSFPDSRRLARFKREARAAARLHHTNIVPVFDVGQVNGVHFYAMQHIEGIGFDVIISTLESQRSSPADSSPDLGTRRELIDVILGGLRTGEFDGESVGAGDTLEAGEAIDRSATTQSFPDGRSNVHDGGVPRDSGGLASVRSGQPIYTGSPYSARHRSRAARWMIRGCMTALSQIRGFWARRHRVERLLPTKYYREIARVSLEIAEALACVHRAGIHHRDIKPSNLLIDKYGRAWITDFGLAKMEDGENLTEGNPAPGTLRYMAPEGHSNSIHRAKADSADVYSLGATLYELLTLHPIFKETQRHRLIKEVLETEPKRPRSLDRRIPRDLETIVLACIEKDPSKRYKSASALAEDLRRFLADLPIAARRVAQPERAWRWCRRNRTVSALGTTVVLLLVTFLVYQRKQTELLNIQVSKYEHLFIKSRHIWGMAEVRAKDALKKQAALEGVLYINSLQNAREASENSDITLAERNLAQCPAGRRDWEWYYLDRLFHRDDRTFAGHSGDVQSLAYSRDGTKIISGARDRYNPLLLWDAMTGDILVRFDALGEVESVACSADGRRIVAGTADGALTVWDVSSAKKQLELKEAGPGIVRDVRFTQGDTRIAAFCKGIRRGRLRIWDAKTGKAVDALPEDLGGSDNAAFGSGGQVAVIEAGHVSLWKMGSRRKICDLPSERVRSRVVAYSPDERRLAVAGYNQIELWNLSGLGSGTRPESYQVLSGHSSPILHIAFSPDGRCLASCDEGRVINYWDVESGEKLHAFRGHAAAVNHLAFKPDGLGLASAGGHEVKVWDIDKGHQIILREHPGWVHGVAFGPKGTRLAVADWASLAVRLYDMSTGRFIREFSRPAEGSGRRTAFTGVAYSSDGTWLAASCNDGTTWLWNTMNADEPRCLRGHGDEVFAVAFSPDSKTLATASGAQDGKISVWETETGEETRRLIGHSRGVLCLAFSLDGTHLASGAGESRRAENKGSGELAVWNLKTGHAEFLKKGLERSVLSITFSPRGDRIASASYLRKAGRDGEFTIWTATGEEELTYHDPGGQVIGVVFIPPGKMPPYREATRIASINEEGVIRIWDAESDREILSIRGHQRGGLCITASDDGRLLATGAEDRLVKLWDATPR